MGILVGLDEIGEDDQIVVLLRRQRLPVAQGVEHGDRPVQLGLRTDQAGWGQT